jgi:hypothetical protein
MPRHRRAALAALVAFPLLAGCGARDATRGSVKDDVIEQLRERADNPITGDEADTVAQCVADAMFDPEQFSKDERDAATRSVDADEPDPDLVDKLQGVFDRCGAND